jgi:hypothetical protein
MPAPFENSIFKELHLTARDTSPDRQDHTSVYTKN